MPSFAVTGIASRLLNMKKKAEPKANTTEETDRMSVYDASSYYTDGSYPPSVDIPNILSPTSEVDGSSILGDSVKVELPDEKAERGVKQAEAIAAVWSRKALVFAYIGIFLVFFLCSLQQQIATNLTAYVTSEFSKHSLLSITQVVSSIVGAVAKLPTAKIINIWGRAEGYILMVTICTVGLAMMALCNSVQMYAAAQVCYWIGYNGMAYVLQVFLADTSHIKNRGWLFAFSTSPYVVTAFAGPLAAQKFYEVTGWRWAFGTFAIVFPVISAPIAMIFLYGRRKAFKTGILSEDRKKRSLGKALIYHFNNFDVVGIILVITGFSLILLSISLGSYHIIQWESATFICMVVFGVISLALFVVWERFFATSCLAPFHLLTDRMVLGACLNSATMFVSFYCWDMYFVSFLQVVYNQTIEHAGYISNIYSIGGCLWAVVIGGIIRKTGHFKWIAMIFVPVQIIGVCVMIFFRRPHTAIGVVIAAQVIISLSAGTLMICEEMAVMAAANHNDIAIVLALLGLFSNLGGAIGQTLSGVIWTETVPASLVELLPESAKEKAMDIYASLPAQLAYQMGTLEREAIMQAYAVGMHRMLIAGVALLPLAFVWVAMWRDIQLKNMTQVKGNIV